jgi:ABC-2 type transport system ATP-binding protein
VAIGVSIWGAGGLVSGVETKNLTRVFTMRQEGRVRETLAVDALNLSVAPGELFGLLGVNGAGKTTTIKMLATLLEPTSGEAWVAGRSVTTEPRAVRANLGCLLPGERTLYWKLTARENLHFFGTLHGMPPRRLKQRVSEALELVGLADRSDERVEKFSSGMKQRLALARTILHEPPVLFFDEPTTGLDIHSARSLRALILDLAGAGRTVLLTTHNLQEAQGLCDRVGIIHRGRLVALDSPENLRRASSASDIVVLRFGPGPAGGVRGVSPDHPVSLRQVVAAVASEAAARVGLPVPEVSVAGDQADATDSATAEADGLEIAVKGRGAADYAAELLVVLRDRGLRALGLETRRPELEDVFIELTGHQASASSGEVAAEGVDAG